MAALVAAAALLAVSAPGARAQETDKEKILNLYNWADYTAPDTIANFEKRYGIKVRYDNFGSDNEMEAKLMAGGTDYDVVVPSTMFYPREVKAGLYAPLDKAALTNWKNLDPAVLKSISDSGTDKDNVYAMPYIQGYTSFIYNEDLVRKILPDAPVDSLRMLFDPAVAGKLKACGINYVDSPEDVVQLALLYNGKSPNTQDPADIKAAYETLAKVRDTVRTVDSTNYLNALAAGDICISIGWVGNDIQAAAQAKKAGKEVKLHFVIPKEGMPEYIDNMMILKDAPHPKNAQLFLNYLMEAKVAADIINALGYPMPNLAARPMIQPEILNNNTIYPDAESLKRIVVQIPRTAEANQAVANGWVRFSRPVAARARDRRPSGAAVPACHASAAREVEGEGIAAMIIARIEHRLALLGEAGLGDEQPWIGRAGAEQAGHRRRQGHRRHRGARHARPPAGAVEQVVERSLEFRVGEALRQGIAAHDLDAIDQRLAPLQAEALDRQHRRAGAAAQRAGRLLAGRLPAHRQQAGARPVAELAQHRGDALIGGNRTLDAQRGRRRDEAAAAMGGADQPVLLEQLQGLAQHRPRDAEQPGELGLRGQPVAGLQAVAHDQRHHRIARQQPDRLVAAELQGGRTARSAAHHRYAANLPARPRQVKARPHRPRIHKAWRARQTSDDRSLPRSDGSADIMLNLDEARFLRIQSDAVALARPIDETIGRRLGGGRQNIFFLGTGGAAVLMQPAARLLARASALPGISPALRALISPVLLATVRERVAAHLEAVRNHPLTTRRCYNRVAC
ncbi:MAG: extracellular solute-binding protein [Dongiaceae bacterium]